MAPGPADQEEKRVACRLAVEAGLRQDVDGGGLDRIGTSAGVGIMKEWLAGG